MFDGTIVTNLLRVCTFILLPTDVSNILFLPLVILKCVYTRQPGSAADPEQSSEDDRGFVCFLSENTLLQ